MGADPARHRRRRRTRSSRRGCVLVVVCAIVGALGIDVLGRAIKVGIAAEIVASVGIGLALLLVFRDAGPLDPRRTRSAPRRCRAARSAPGCSPRSRSAAGCSSASTPASARRRRRRDAARHVPRAIWIALLSVARARDPQRGRGRRSRIPIRPPSSPGATSIPVTTAVVTLVRLVVGEAVRRDRARRVPRLRHGGPGAHRAHDLLDRARRRAAGLALPAARRPPPVADRRDRRRRPSSRASACCSACNSAAVGSLIAFGTAAIYVAFLLVALAALIARVRGTWVPAGRRPARSRRRS